MGKNPQDASWLILPQRGIPFSGLETNVEPVFVGDTAHVAGMNTYVNDGDRISTRPFGLSLFPVDGTISVAPGGIRSMWTFRLRTGENIMLRSYTTFLEWFDETSNAWVVLRSGLQSDDFGFAEFNVNANAESRLYHGNGVDDFAYWNGGHTNLTSALVGGETTIPVTSTASFTIFPATTLTAPLVGGEVVAFVVDTSAFPASGAVSINGNIAGYNSKTATQFNLGSPFVGTGSIGDPVTDDTTADIVIGGVTYTYDYFTSTTLHITVPFVGTATSGLAVAQAVVTSSSAPKGNIYMSAQNRLFIVPSINKELIQFCAYGDANTWLTTTVSSATATAAGAFNLIEGGGEVTAMAQDEQSLYFFKTTCTYKATLSDSLYTLQMLKPFDGRSRATGALGRRGVFIGGNFIFIVTPDRQIKALERVETIDYPQLSPISEPITPTAAALDFSQVAGISFQDYAYFACKSSSAAEVNDTVLPFNIIKGHWENPITGWQVGEWVIYDDGTGNKLYFGDAISPNTWELNPATITDGEYIISSAWYGKRFDFGHASEQKALDDFYILGKITPTTELTIQMLYDEAGSSGSLETTFSGDETPFVIPSTESENLFGLNPFGIEVFGSNTDQSGSRYFRVHLRKNLREVPLFYNLQVAFSSSGANQRWEIIQMGFLWRVDKQPTRTNLLRDW